MSRFGLLHDIKYVLSNSIRLDDLLAAMFSDHPELKTVEYSVTSEYDDNNYTDYSRLQKINGWEVDCEGEFEEDQDEDLDEATKPSAAAINAAMLLDEYVQEKFGVGDWEFKRSEYPMKDCDERLGDNPEMECAVALLHGRKVPVETLAVACGRWVMRHAEVHGRYSTEDEIKVFAREGMMRDACEYAEKFGPLSEKTLSWFLLYSQKDDVDYQHLQDYLERLKAA